MKKHNRFLLFAVSFCVLLSFVSCGGAGGVAQGGAGTDLYFLVGGRDDVAGEGNG